METQNKKENIRQRAYLNSVTAWIDTIVKLIVRFIIDPFIISFLGGFYYGIWQIINQLNSYLATTDLRAATALKWIIAKDRTTKSEYELKQSVSSSLYTNFIFLPLYLITGAIIVYYVPYITKVSSEDFFLVRKTSAIMVLAFIITQIFFLFESVLHGMNLSYKRLGIRSIITILGGVFTFILLSCGFSIDGLAIVNVFIALATGLTFALIVKKIVPWFGFVKVRFNQIMSFAKLSGWFMIDKIVNLLNESIDLILLGYFASAQYVTMYTISRFTIQAVSSIYRSGQGAIVPGITRFLGENKFDKIIYFRKSMIIMNWFVLGIFGSVIILLNRSFIGLWTNQDYFAGSYETFLIVLLALLKSLYSIDDSIITMNLNLKKKIIISAISALMTIIMSIILIPQFHIIGLLISLIIGLLLRMVIFSSIAKDIVNGSNFIPNLFFSRISLFSLFILGISTYLSQYIMVDKWFNLFLYAFFYLLLIVPLYWFMGLNKLNRDFLIENLRRIKPTKLD
ncbi:oligosaccharide flippase family protein [Proteiniphilum sp. UBA5384]|uniref:oligosaccharide flippase family protein n=1 Tax=Proteiniphilum sp. UBA5384 TaxID=1947279 RepID=UPI002600F747|nr:oligosaccharide flippase family protein [Proteiniphilum sp. UBA5384]